MSLASLLGIVEASHAQGNPVTAIDILLEPDATMVQHAHADNARLLRAYPKGFALDATHHSTMIIRPPQHGHRRRAIIQTGQGFEPPITARCAPRRSWEDAHSPLAPSNRQEPHARPAYVRLRLKFFPLSPVTIRLQTGFLHRDVGADYFPFNWVKGFVRHRLNPLASGSRKASPSPIARP